MIRYKHHCMEDGEMSIKMGDFMYALENEKYTTDYVLSLPEGQRAELIDGVVYDMAALGLTHQRISIQLASDIRSYIQSRQGDCEVLTAPFGVFLLDDDKNYVEPDISVICDSKKLTSVVNWMTFTNEW